MASALKFWKNGLPVAGVDSWTSGGGVDTWKDGLPVVFYTAAGGGTVIMPQLQESNLGASLFNGALIG